MSFPFPSPSERPEHLLITPFEMKLEIRQERQGLDGRAHDRELPFGLLVGQ